MDRKDFATWFYSEPDWNEVAFQYNTGKKYQQKQDLIAVFANGYINYELKLEPYFKEFKEIPHDFLNNQIFKFRKSFPKNGRVDGINYFDDLMELLINKYSNSIQKVETTTIQDQPDFESEIIKIKNSENRFWKGIPMVKVIEHFEVMTKRKNKNDCYFITKDQFISFLKRGFLSDTSQPKQKINYSFGEKGKVILRFYEFYNIAASEFGHPNRKKNFIKLLTDCFDNWEEKTVKSFFKPGKAIEKW